MRSSFHTSIIFFYKLVTYVNVDADLYNPDDRVTLRHIWLPPPLVNATFEDITQNSTCTEAAVPDPDTPESTTLQLESTPSASSGAVDVFERQIDGVAGAVGTTTTTTAILTRTTTRTTTTTATTTATAVRTASATVTTTATLTSTTTTVTTATVTSTSVPTPAPDEDDDEDDDDDDGDNDDEDDDDDEDGLVIVVPPEVSKYPKSVDKANKLTGILLTLVRGLVCGSRGIRRKPKSIRLLARELRYNFFFLLIKCDDLDCQCNAASASDLAECLNCYALIVGNVTEAQEVYDCASYRLSKSIFPLFLKN